MRKTKIIPIHQIRYDKLPINESGLATTKWIAAGNADRKPIKVIALKDGSYKLKDGRHRVLGHKLNGLTHIKARVSYDFKEN